jgi:erythromycin esterase-like protein
MNMADADATHATLKEWIATEAIPFTLDSAESVDAAVDRFMTTIDGAVDVLGLGEPTHGAEVFLEFRNRVFQRLVEKHGFTAITLESSFPRGRLIDEYVAARGPATYDEVRERGLSHGFDASGANRELIEWMRRYNVEHRERRLRFDGFDSPTEMTHTDSPRVMLHFVLDYLAANEVPGVAERRQRIDELLADDAAWENSEANLDPTKSIGLSPTAKSLATEATKLSAELRTRKAALIASSGEGRYLEAARYAAGARQLITYHALVATPSERRLADLLGQRDVMMADNLKYIVERERLRGGKVLAFAHNSHLKVGKAAWQWGENRLEWWPAGSHVRAMMGGRYVVIGTSIARLKSHELAAPEEGTLEALLAAAGSSLLIPTHAGQSLQAGEVAALTTRTTGPRYFPFNVQSFTDFDWLAMLN